MHEPHAAVPRPDPSPRELRLFGWLLLAFFAGLAALVRWRPEALLAAGAVTGAAWLGALALARELPAPVLRRGVLLPSLFLAAGLPALLGAPRPAVALVVAAGGGALALAALASTERAGRVYALWMDAALPVGWSVSRVLLAGVWYAVVTPIGLALRIGGRDAMGRRFDPEAASYWSERRPPESSERYFRQY